jgi:hypothetical protein
MSFVLGTRLVGTSAGVFEGADKNRDSPALIGV